MKNKKIAVVGAGNMGGALIAGLVQSNLLPSDRITAVDVLEAPLEKLRSAFGVKVSQSVQEAVKSQDVVVLAVKPQVWRSVVEKWAWETAPDQLLISIMAGVCTTAVEEMLVAETPVIRAMPNILAQIQAAISALCRGRYATDAHIRTASTILGTIGKTVVVDEWQMDAVTGLSGSGPAYVYAIIDALADGGVKAGLPKAVALQLAAQTVLGSAKMVMESGEHPAVLKDRVTSPGGTTIAGLYAMECGSFRASLMSAVEAAAERSRELGA